MNTNLLQDLPASGPEEWLDTLVDAENVTVERIVSHGHTSPSTGWYDQPRHEWVMVLTGRGVVAFEDGEEVTLGPGDYLNIPAHRRHRVAWTTPDEPTVWLAIHYN